MDINPNTSQNDLFLGYETKKTQPSMPEDAEKQKALQLKFDVSRLIDIRKKIYDAEKKS